MRMQVIGNAPILGLSSKFMTIHYVSMLFFLPVTYTVLHTYMKWPT